jgi:hypothetical protein
MALHAAAHLEPDTVGDRYPRQYLRGRPSSCGAVLDSAVTNVQ